MKPEWNRKYATICIYAFLTAAAVIVFLSAILYRESLFKFIGMLFSVLSPVIYGVAIAYLLAPLDRLIGSALGHIFAKSKRNTSKLRGILSIVLTYTVFLLAITAFVFVAAPDIGASINNISSNLTTYYNTAVNYIQNIDLPFMEIPEISMEIQDIIKHIYDILRGFLPKAYMFFEGFVTEVMNFVIGVLISIYVLAGRVKFKNSCKRFLRAVFDDGKVKRVTSFFSDVDRTFGGFISGKILDSVIIGILCFILMSIFRMPNAALISLIVGVTNVIPVFGPFIGAIPSGLIILLADPPKTIWFIILIIALQQLDGNVIGPKILGDSTGLPAFWVIFSLLLFGGFFGVFGMLIAVPVFALIYNGIKNFTDKRLAMKNNERKNTNVGNSDSK